MGKENLRRPTRFFSVVQLILLGSCLVGQWKCSVAGAATPQDNSVLEYGYNNGSATEATVQTNSTSGFYASNTSNGSMTDATVETNSASGFYASITKLLSAVSTTESTNLSTSQQTSEKGSNPQSTAVQYTSSIRPSTLSSTSSQNIFPSTITRQTSEKGSNPQSTGVPYTTSIRPSTLLSTSSENIFPSTNTTTTFSTGNFTTCLQQSDTKKFLIPANPGIVFEFKGSDVNGSLDGSCWVNMEVPQGQVMKFEVVEQNFGCEGIGKNMVIMWDLFNFESLMTSKAPCNFYPSVHSYSHRIRLYVSVRAGMAYRINFVLRVTAVTESQRPHLEVTFVNPRSGFIQTPGWDGVTRYNDAMDSETLIDVTPHHVIMFSVPHMDLDLFGLRVGVMGCLGDYVEIRLEGDNITTFTLCGKESFPPKLYPPAKKISIRYFSKVETANAGFQLQFSFHNESVLPQQLPDGRWNCSVPHWPDFRQHLPCNLLNDCLEGQDELDCPYTRLDRCPRGYFAVGDGCYLNVKPTSPVTWDEASTDCRLRGAHLISLNSGEEWEGVTSLLHQYRFSGKTYIGLHTSFPSLPIMYRYMFQWADGVMAYLVHLPSELKGTLACAYLQLTPEQYTQIPPVVLPTTCTAMADVKYICEKNHYFDVSKLNKSLPISLNASLEASKTYSKCPLLHFTHAYLACDSETACFGFTENTVAICKAPLTPLPPMFTCDNQDVRVPYTSVCDHRADCSDHSDEDFCVFPACPEHYFRCENKQCIPPGQVCDGVEDCVNGVDELMCPSPSYRYPDVIHTSLGDAISLDGNGTFSIHSWNKTSNSCNTTSNSCNKTTNWCPDTHFRCPGPAFYCLPVYVRCNDVYDCPGREDEAECDSYTCPGLYRCRASHVCLHPTHLCDGVFQCPQHDDEWFCSTACPSSCTCHGNAFFCSSRVTVHEHPDLRYLDGKGSGLSPGDVSNNTMLIHLSLAFCGLKLLDFSLLVNLLTLDLSNNLITELTASQTQNLPSLRSLSLANNPLQFTYSYNGSLPFVTKLDLSGIRMAKLATSALTLTPNVLELNLSGSGIDSFDGGFRSISKLRVVDLRGCPVTQFPRDVFEGLQDLQAVFADNYKLCCPATLPDAFNLNHCLAPSDEISSCDALLRSDVYRVMLAVFAALALLGNVCSLLYRVVSKVASNSGFAVFVTHLCVSDLLMGVYLATIGVADRLYLGTYLWQDTTWKASMACQVAGFLSLLSSEVSAFLICLITLDRFLVLRFPFSQLHFHPRSAHVACAVLWCVGLSLAAVPLLPATQHWHYYSQTGICIPLPITRKAFGGQRYSFGIIIVLNFVLFLLIAVGQLVIYWSIRTNSMSSADTSRKSKDLTIARRLLTVAMSDFLCWFPIGVLGLMASKGVAVPGEVSVAMAILVLPLNSALNPFLYTINVVLEKRRRVKEQRLKKLMYGQTFRNKSMASVTEADMLSVTKKVDGGVLLENLLSSKCLTSAEALVIINKHHQYKLELDSEGGKTPSATLTV